MSPETPVPPAGAVLDAGEPVEPIDEMSRRLRIPVFARDGCAWVRVEERSEAA